MSRPWRRMHPMGQTGTQKPVLGFGLLEAIVSLVLLASTGVALFAWISQNLQAAARVEATQARLELQRVALGLVKSVNPYLEPTGTRKMGATRVEWRSRLVAPSRVSVPTEPMTSARWRVSLYELSVEAFDDIHVVTTTFSVMQTGLESLEGATASTLKPEAP